jgi:hypothetical protein
MAGRCRRGAAGIHDLTMTKLPVWRVWKKRKRLTVSAVYEDRATEDRVNDFCQSLSSDLGQHCEIIRGMWPASELRLPQLRSIAADEAALADLIIVSVHAVESLSDEMKGWVDQWIGRKDRRAAVLLALFDPLSRGISSPIEAYLQEVAKKGRMEFVAQSQETSEDP